MRPVLAITGATASGKSSLALGIAEACGGEIVSLDSRQVYAGLVIGTAAPTTGEQARVRHHLIGTQDPASPLSAGAYARLVAACIDDIQGRGVTPILVGGSTLYLEAVAHGLSPAAEVEIDMGALAGELSTERGRARLFAELQAADPAAAALARHDQDAAPRPFRGASPSHRAPTE